MIKQSNQIVTASPTEGSRVQPSGEDRYFMVKFVRQGYAYYDWLPDGADDNSYVRRTERRVDIKKLVKTNNRGLEIWVEYPR